MSRWRRSAGKLLASLASGLLTACGILTPLPEATSLDQRLGAIPVDDAPLQGPVTIHWDGHQIPFVEAGDDTDAAFALGLVHAHLRLGQMEMFRRISQGRIAEMGGPLATDIDHGLRIIDFDRAAPEIEASLPPATRRWVESFVAGINFYLDNTTALPAEFAILGLERERWTVQDIITMGRLAATDVNWLVWFSLLPLRQRDDWPEIWARLVGDGSVPLLETAGGGDPLRLDAILGAGARSGSNSVAIAPGRSASGGAILANDPHLGLLIPNTWIIAGVKSPSYHAVGLMAPGLPVFAIGRNPRIAWGGTNLRAASSELFALAEGAANGLGERSEEIDVRWWFDRDITVRDSAWGPVLSDAPQLAGLGGPDFALKWIGHAPSDEITTFLKVSQADDFPAFRDAFADFAVPGQNMLYADADGNIGMIMAARLPKRDGEAPADVILDAEARLAWESTVGTTELPYAYNPERGYLVSANNRPGAAPVPVGYFFSPDDRVGRMAEIIEGTERIDRAAIAALQQDVHMASSVVFRDVLVEKAAETGIGATLDPDAAGALSLIEAWDGYYTTDSRGAVAFEALRAAFLPKFYEVEFGEQDWAAYAGIDRTQQLTIEDIRAAGAERLRPAFSAGLAASVAALGNGTTWGDMHRLVIQHPLANLPVVGGRYRFGDLAVGGSSETLMKTAHSPAAERHRVRYGSNARHVSDLSDIDANYFVLLGGQDGWFNSSTFLDQLPYWQAGEYIQMPLSLDAVREAFPHKTVLSP